VASALVLATAGLGVGSPASAAQIATPTCVQTSTWDDFPWTYADATNRCSTSQRFYFRWDRAVDGGCNTLQVNWRRSEGRAYQARFAGLTDC
jgi:hypothetical protein